MICAKSANFLAGKGVTAWLPTFVPDADENYRKVIAAIDEVMETQANEADCTNRRRALRRRFCQQKNVRSTASRIFQNLQKRR